MGQRTYHQRKRAASQPERLTDRNSAPALPAALRRATNAGRPLDSSTRATLEPRFGHSFADVRVHSDTNAAESAAALGARAYTVGSDIVFDEGQYAPETSEGERLLAHELAHVVQRRAGPPAAKAVSQSGDAAEHEARAAADQVVAGEAAQVQTTPSAALSREEKEENSPLRTAWGIATNDVLGGIIDFVDAAGVGGRAPGITGGLLGPLSMIDGGKNIYDNLTGKSPFGLNNAVEVAKGAGNVFSGGTSFASMVGWLPQVAGSTSLGTIGAAGAGSIATAAGAVTSAGLMGYGVGDWLANNTSGGQTSADTWGLMDQGLGAFGKLTGLKAEDDQRSTMLEMTEWAEDNPWKAAALAPIALPALLGAGAIAGGVGLGSGIADLNGRAIDGISGIGNMAVDGISKFVGGLGLPEGGLPEIGLPMPDIGLPLPDIGLPDFGLPSFGTPRPTLPDRGIPGPGPSNLPPLAPGQPAPRLSEREIGPSLIGFPSASPGLGLLDRGFPGPGPFDFGLPDFGGLNPFEDAGIGQPFGVPDFGLPMPDFGLPEGGLPELGLPMPDISMPDFGGLNPFDDAGIGQPFGVPDFGLPMPDFGLPEGGLPELGLPMPDIGLPDFGGLNPFDDAGIGQPFGVPDFGLPDIGLPDLSGFDPFEDAGIGKPMTVPDFGLPDLGDLPIPDLGLPEGGLPELGLPMPDIGLPMPDIGLPEGGLPELGLPMPDLGLPLPDLGGLNPFEDAGIGKPLTVPDFELPNPLDWF